jgi:hypothetical protein
MADVWNLKEILETIAPLIEVLEQLEIEYHLGGSVASSVYGERRRTQDVDIVALLQSSHVRRFIALLNHDYYLSESSIRDAIRLRSSFNLIFFNTGFKIDIFIPKLRAFDQDELHHIQYISLEDGGRAFPVASAESMVLRKLEWYEMGGRMSDRQWQRYYSPFTEERRFP